MRQQEGVHDDFQLDIQLDRGDHEEGFGRQERDDDEEGNYKEDVEQEDGYKYLAVCISSSLAVSHALTFPGSR